MRAARAPGVFSTILKAPPLASQVPILALVALKFSGEVTLNVTSGVVKGTLAGMAFWDVASETRQRSPEITLACAVVNDARAIMDRVLVNMMLLNVFTLGLPRPMTIWP
jgi:hypothetical protein